jgi:hypothetical protein
MKITYICIKQVILYYSFLLSSIIFIGGLFTIKTSADLIVNLLFLPIVAYFSMEIIEKSKLKKDRVKTISQK